MERRTVIVGGVGALGLFASAGAFAQNAAQPNPRRQITIVVPFSPGGAIDLVARLVGQKLSEAWGQPVVAMSEAGLPG